MDKRYRITLDTDKQDILDTHIVICQGDKGFVFDIELVGIDMTNATARLIIHKPDNNVIESALTESNGRYTYTFLGNEVSTAGTVVADVKIIESTTKRVSTTRFKFYVEIDTISGAVIESQSYSTSLENAINQAKRYAVGGVEDGDATDNAKYYKEQAEYAASQASAATGILDENGKILSSLMPTDIINLTTYTNLIDIGLSTSSLVETTDDVATVVNAMADESMAVFTFANGQFGLPQEDSGTIDIKRHNINRVSLIAIGTKNTLCFGTYHSKYGFSGWYKSATINSNIANNLTTTEEGFALDARQGLYLFQLIEKKATIKSGTFSGSTDSNGNVVIVEQAIRVISVEIDQDYLPTPFVSPVTHYTYINVKYFSGATLSEGTTISGTYYYVE